MSDPVSRQECVINHQGFNTRMDKLETKIDELNVKLAELPKALIDELDNRYASKAVEKIIWAVGGIVGTAIVGAILALILKN